MNFSNADEAQMRREQIDRQLAQAGWDVSEPSVVTELRLTDAHGTLRESGVTYDTGSEYVDYALLGRDGKPIAIVEAKRASRDALAGKRQAADYADHVVQQFGTEPFIFLTNGEKILFWDRALYAPRAISGFYTRDDLERLVFQRRYRQDLSQLSPNTDIVDRPYQFEAIRRVTEAIEQSRRKFLLVMATGTGKTRTAIALIDLLMRAKWIGRVLFLADRRALVQQALGDFKDHMSSETRARVESGQVDDMARIHVATYPSMMQVYQALSPGYYDLIVADESHRSIYNRYKSLLDHFDALQLGLTATPTDYIDHNTFELFACSDGLPTFNYDYRAAVDEKYLADYRVLDAQTTFQIEGIKAGQLPPALQRQLEEQGIELDEINFDGSDLERRVTNTGTTDAMVREFMEKCRRDASGTLPAKTIIFAMSHAHAVRLYESFNRLFPDLQRRGMAEIIDSHMERVDATLNDFKRRDMPRVAISVDMLDTGIDVPAIQNLVFAKPVFSQVKFWQMIGRGTRLWTDPETGQQKTDFLIIDFWNNFAYFNMNPEGELASTTEPLPVRLFRLRLEKLALLRGRGEQTAIDETVQQLQKMLAWIPHDNINVRPHVEELRRLAHVGAWNVLDDAQFDRLRNQIAPLLRFLPDVNLSVMTFETRTERLAVAHLAGQSEQVASLQEKVVADLALLPTSLQAVQTQRAKLDWICNGDFWDGLDYARILDLQHTFAPLMRYRQRRRPQMVELNLHDEIARRHWIIYGPSGEGTFADAYREQVEARIVQLAREHPTLHKLQQGQPLDETDVRALARVLSEPDLYIQESTLRKLYNQPDATLVDFLRHILGVSKLPNFADRIEAAFDQFIAAHPHFAADQLRFLRVVRSLVLRRTQLTSQDLQRPPLNRVGDPHRLFAEDELAEIIAFANRLAA